MNQFLTVFLNTKSGDSICPSICDLLKKSDSIKKLNIETNYFTIGSLLNILDTIQTSCPSLRELRVDNQVQNIGIHGEAKIAAALIKCQMITKFGMTFKSATSRNSVNQKLTENTWNIRKQKL